MEITYKSSREDLEAYYDQLWVGRKRPQRSDFYYAVFWHLALLGLAVFVAIKHEDFFAVCVFGVLAVFYLKQNWSFDRHWRAGVQASARTVPEHTSCLVLDEAGIIERFMGIELRVPWSEVKGYTLAEERLLIHHLEQWAFLVPLKQLSEVERTDLFAMLERYRIKNRS